MRFLTREQLRALLEAAKAEPREHLLILLAYAHGLRSTEAVNVWLGPTTARIKTIKNGKVSSVPAPYIESNTLIVQRLKGSECTRQPLVTNPDPLFDEVGLLAGLPNGRLFPDWTRHDFNNLMRAYGKRGVIPQYLAHPHALKRSIGKHMVRGAGLENTSVYLGHKNWNSTKSYAKSTDAEASQAMTEAVFGREEAA
jgi:site-specific recombinase XerD